jgi:hypothetical protein
MISRYAKFASVRHRRTVIAGRRRSVTLVRRSHRQECLCYLASARRASLQRRQECLCYLFFLVPRLLPGNALSARLCLALVWSRIGSISKAEPGNQKNGRRPHRRAASPRVYSLGAKFPCRVSLAPAPSASRVRRSNYRHLQCPSDQTHHSAKSMVRLVLDSTRCRKFGRRTLLPWNCWLPSTSGAGAAVCSPSYAYLAGGEVR